MNETSSHAGWAMFRHRDFRFYILGRLCTTLAFQMSGTAVGWQIYAITGDPLDLGLVGLVQFIPILTFGLLGGHTADRYDRATILKSCMALAGLGMVALVALTLHRASAIWPILAVLALLSVGRAFFAPAAQALMPNLVPISDLPAAVAWNSSMFQMATISGPAIAGVLLLSGVAWVYATAAVLTLLSLAFLARIAKRSVHAEHEGLSWASLTMGLRYVWGNRMVLGAISLDLVAVLLGGVTALLPIFAADILQVGAAGYGWLRAAPALGAGAMALTLAQRPLRRHLGRAMLSGVACYGVATFAFGLSATFWLSFAMLAVAGAADLVSVYVRQNLVQMATPDAMRGRVSAVSSVFITASNELGDFESGALAALIGAVPCVVVGAVGTLAVTAVWARVFPGIRAFDRPEDAKASA